MIEKLKEGPKVEPRKFYQIASRLSKLHKASPVAKGISNDDNLILSKD